MAVTPSSVLALDVGTKRVGVAVASLAARLPRRLITLERDDNFWQQLTELINREEIGAVVIGGPRGLDGQTTAQTAATESFEGELKQRFAELPIHRQDEALTSKQAETELRARGKAYGRGDIDALAANYILADWLAEQTERVA
jgi:putative Holliday junction resolvase